MRSIAWDRRPRIEATQGQLILASYLHCQSTINGYEGWRFIFQIFDVLGICRSFLYNNPAIYSILCTKTAAWEFIRTYSEPCKNVLEYNFFSDMLESGQKLITKSTM